MKLESEILLDFSDVLIKPAKSTLTSRKEIDLRRTYNFKHSGLEWTGVPIMAANMDGVGTTEMAITLEQHEMFTCLTKTTTEIPWILNPSRYAVSTGISESDFDRLESVLSCDSFIQFICIDVANGYSTAFVDFISKVRNAFPTKTIIAGNVVTAEMTSELIMAGADIVKIGIGPGSVCTTRIQTGVGYPQLSAIIECSEAAHELEAHVIADGGCTSPGDVAKAFGAGADFVMLGGMLAGHDQGGGEMFTRWKMTGYYTDEADPILRGERKVQFYGMSSETAMKKHHGGVADYRSSEGRTVEIPYRGSVEVTVKDILGGLRSTCTYVGAETLKELTDRTTFVRVNNQFNSSLVR